MFYYYNYGHSAVIIVYQIVYLSIGYGSDEMIEYTTTPSGYLLVSCFDLDNYPAAFTLHVLS